MKILILTSEYPNPNSNFDTPVVHYYAKEWKNHGHEIKVIHYRSVFPQIFYVFANIFNRLVKKVFKTDFIPVVRLDNSIEYLHEGIEVNSKPIFKIFPHFKFFNSTIKREARSVYNDNLNNSFTPDRIITHFFNPQLPLIKELKTYYPNVTASLVIHEDPKVIHNLYKEKAHLLFNSVDKIGFRFQEMKNKFTNYFGEKYEMFLCPSGIPENYILKNVPNTKFKGEILSICFVGMLIPLKNVDILLDSLVLAFPDKNFKLDIIGEGMLRDKLQSKINTLGLDNCVKLLGKISRDEVQKRMTDSDVFAMVSSPEAFGLVYLEAMSKGCITIGTKNQGIDGVIKNGINGFLCEARNVEALKEILIEIKKMPLKRKQEIAKRALETTWSFTNKKIALDYLNKIEL